MAGFRGRFGELFFDSIHLVADGVCDLAAELDESRNDLRHLAEAEHACRLLVEAGIPMGCQTVLLRGVNDSPTALQHLMRRLVAIRVRPYYLHQMDPVAGTAHFRVPIRQGLALMQSLRGHMSGLRVPQYMIIPFVEL